jgi:hypothetical protein
MKNISRFAVWTAVLPLVVSCNLWRPFTSAHSDEDYIEEAQRCLHHNDFGCAAQNYSMLSDRELRLEKLCAVNLAGAGFTISNLVNTISTDTDHVLGNLAEATLPWSPSKKAFADAAKAVCEDYQDAVSSAPQAKRDLGILLKTLSLFMHCANLIAKTDQFVSHDTNDTDCDKAGNGDGQITQADVSTDVNADLKNSAGAIPLRAALRTVIGN